MEEEPIYNIYEISQSINNDYDTYDSAVVIALNEEKAALIHPDGSDNNIVPRNKFSDTWARPEHVNVELIGEACPGFDGVKVIVVASFNAG